MSRLIHPTLQNALAPFMPPPAGDLDRDGAASTKGGSCSSDVPPKYATAFLDMELCNEKGEPFGVLFHGPQIVGTKIILLFTDKVSGSTFSLPSAGCDPGAILTAARLRRATHQAACQLYSDAHYPPMIVGPVQPKPTSATP